MRLCFTAMIFTSELTQFITGINTPHLRSCRLFLSACLLYEQHIKLLIEKIASIRPGNRNTPGLIQFFIHLFDELVCVGPGDSNSKVTSSTRIKNLSATGEILFVPCRNRLLFVVLLCRSIFQTLTGNPFRRCAVVFSSGQVLIIAYFHGESMPDGRTKAQELWRSLCA